jgi:hypothetical protein
MPSDEEEIPERKGRIRDLEEETEELKKRRDRARGVPAEVLVAQMAGGKRTEGYKDLDDVRTERGNRIEVKFSKVHDSKSSRTKRWTWANVLGPKQYDFLVLAGEKDPRCKGYPSDLVYVFFVVPRSKVDDIKGKGDSVALSTNFPTAGAGKAKILIER